MFSIGIKYKLIIVPALLLATVLIFVLPFYITPFVPNVSASYDYQFNNAISIISVLVILSITFLLVYKIVKDRLNPINVEALFLGDETNHITYTPLAIVIAAHIVFILVFFFLQASYGYGEMNYFLLRIDKLHMGQIPYKDFEFAYGPLLIYLPKYIDDLFKVTSTTGYYYTLILLASVGLFFLHYILNRFSISKKEKQIIFYIIGFSCLPIPLGLNYLLFRFLTPVASIFLFNKILNISTLHVTLRKFLQGFAAALISLINFSISPEMGIAVFLVFEGYLLFFVILQRQFNQIIVITSSLIFILIFSFFISSNQTLVLKTFASGGNNWVIIPSISVVFYLICFIASNVVLGVIVFKKNIPFIPFGLLVFNGIMVCGALGRCDPGHILYDGLSTFLVSWILLSYFRSRYLKAFKVSFIVAFTLILNLTGVFFTVGPLGALVVDYAYHEHKITELQNFCKKYKIYGQIDKYTEKKDPRPYTDLNELKTLKNIAIPFDTHKTVYLFLLNNGLYKPEYYTSYFQDIFTIDQVKTKLNNLQNADHKYMIIPSAIMYHKAADDSVSDKQYISILFCYPYTYKQIKFSKTLYQPVFNYIQSNYRVIKPIKKDELLVERIN